MTDEDLVRRDMRAFWTPFLFGAGAVLFYLGHLQIASRVLWKHESHGLFEQPLTIQIGFGLVMVAGGVMIVWQQIVRPIRNLTHVLGAMKAQQILRSLFFSALTWSPVFAFMLLFSTGGGEIWAPMQLAVSFAIWLLFASRRNKVVERLAAPLAEA